MSTLPTLFFAHANGFPGGSYRTFLAPLGEEFEVVAMDRVGHDPEFPVGPGWHELSRQVERELAGLTGPVTAVGHSMGGVLLFMVASRRPEWFDSLIMLDPPLINGWREVLFGLGRLFGQIDRITPAGRSQGRRAHFRDWQDVEGYFERRGFFQALDPRCLRDYLDAGLESDGGGGWRLRFDPDREVEIFRTTPLGLDRWPRLRVPAMLINGRDSPAPFHDCGRRHARRHGMLYDMAPGGHMFPLEKPDMTARQVSEGLARLREQARVPA